MKNSLEEVLLTYHKEYLRDKENLRYAKDGAEEIFKSSEVEKLYQQRSDLSYNRGEGVGIRTNERGRIRTIAERIKNTFITEGQINIIGAEISGPEELASLLQIYKNPNFETYRLIYMKDNKIAGIEGTTCRLPGVSVTYDPNLSAKEYMERVSARMKELGADGYYMTHNHPSGNVTPSFDDDVATYRYATGIPGFIGHIITDHTVFTYQTKDESKTMVISEKYQLDVFEHCTGNKSLLDLSIHEPHEIANISKMLNLSAGTSLILYSDMNGTVNKVDELPNGFLKSDVFKEYVRNNLIGKGNIAAFCLTDDEDILVDMSDYVIDKYLIDCVLIDGRDHVSARSYLVRSKSIDYAGKTYDSFPCYSFYDTEINDKDIHFQFNEAKKTALYKYLAEMIVTKSCSEPADKNCTVMYEDIEEWISYNEYIENTDVLERELNKRDEVLDVKIVGEKIDVICKEEYRRNLAEKNYLQPIFDNKNSENVADDYIKDNSKVLGKGILIPGGK